MLSQHDHGYLLGEYWLDPARRVLIKDGEQVHLANRPFQVLLYLVEHREELVTRAELLDRFWDGKDVYDDTLRKTVGTIRKALGDPSDHPRFVQTRWAGGYRYIGPCEEAQRELPTIEIERTRGVRVLVEEEISDSHSGETAIAGSATILAGQPPATRRRLALAV